VALLGTDTSAVSSLVELMMGFGTPRAGRVTIDDVGLDQLHDRWLKREVLWVGQSGPIWAGSVLENMSSIDSPVDSGAALEVAKKIGIVDKLQSLPEGLQTILDADDSRLDPAAKYGLALARARLRQPSIVIAQEPPNYNHNGLLGDDPGLEVLTELARLGTLVVLLPQRLQSLRAADRVVLLHQGRFAGEGKHEELLATSDLYRHLNYLLFNPFRQRV
jgi:ABC-type transport system involved in cytochrome bd biosynthesis fused ATPase/permease subunit